MNKCQIFILGLQISEYNNRKMSLKMSININILLRHSLLFLYDKIINKTIYARGGYWDYEIKSPWKFGNAWKIKMDTPPSPDKFTYRPCLNLLLFCPFLIKIWMSIWQNSRDAFYIYLSFILFAIARFA